MVGSALEHGAALLGQKLDFAKLFLEQEEEEEESSTLADALTAMKEIWKNDWFRAADVSQRVNAEELDRHATTLREYFYFGPGVSVLSPKSAGKQLKKQVDNPVRRGDHVLVLKTMRDSHTAELFYRVSVDGSKEPMPTQQSEMKFDQGSKQEHTWKRYDDEFMAALKIALEERGETVIHCGEEMWAVRENVVKTKFATEVRREEPDADKPALAKAWKEAMGWVKVTQFNEDGVDYMMEASS